MKAFSTGYIFLVLTSLVPSAGAAAPPLTIQVSTQDAAYKVGQEIRIVLNLTNATDHDVTVSRARGDAVAELSYSIEVWKGDGAPAQKTEYLRKLTGEYKDPKHPTIFLSSSTQLRLKPGESLREQAVLTKLYVLDKAGSYKIQASHAIPEQLGGGVAKSNLLTITVKK
jgi:hypothetical protein